MSIQPQRHFGQKHLPLVISLILLLGACYSAPKSSIIHNEFPAEIRSEERYVIYLHGRIIEDQGLEHPTSPVFGAYEYDAILTALAVEGLQVISEVRPKDADPFQHANQLADHVQDLLDVGVPPDHITIVGVSKGGAIAILTALLLQNDNLQFVFLASCGEEVLDDQSLTIAGRMLSIYEAADDMALSCQPLFERSSTGSTFQEIRLETGLGHGEFYTPRADWIEPTVRMALGED